MISAKNLLNKRLAPDNYFPSKFNPGLYTHHTMDTIVTSFVDDFGVEYTPKENDSYLIGFFAKKLFTHDIFAGSSYVGITLWAEFSNKTCHMLDSVVMW